MNRDFAEMLSASSEAGADDLVIGAHALAGHGVTRPTGDPDVPMLGREILIRNKRALGRPRDLADVAEPEAATEDRD